MINNKAFENKLHDRSKILLSSVQTETAVELQKKIPCPITLLIVQVMSFRTDHFSITDIVKIMAD